MSAAAPSTEPPWLVSSKSVTPEAAPPTTTTGGGGSHSSPDAGHHHPTTTPPGTQAARLSSFRAFEDNPDSPSAPSSTSPGRTGPPPTSAQHQSSSAGPPPPLRQTAYQQLTLDANGASPSGAAGSPPSNGSGQHHRHSGSYAEHSSSTTGPPHILRRQQTQPSTAIAAAAQHTASTTDKSPAHLLLPEARDDELLLSPNVSNMSPKGTPGAPPPPPLIPSLAPGMRPSGVPSAPSPKHTPASSPRSGGGSSGNVTTTAAVGGQVILRTGSMRKARDGSTPKAAAGTKNGPGTVFVLSEAEPGVGGARAGAHATGSARLPPPAATTTAPSVSPKTPLPPLGAQPVNSTSASPTASLLPGPPHHVSAADRSPLSVSPNPEGEESLNDTIRAPGNKSAEHGRSPADDYYATRTSKSAASTKSTTASAVALGPPPPPSGGDDDEDKSNDVSPSTLAITDKPGAGDNSGESDNNNGEKTLADIYEEITAAEFSCRHRFYQVVHGTPVLFPDEFISIIYRAVVLISIVVSTISFILETEPNYQGDEVATSIFLILEGTSVGIMTIDLVLHVASSLHWRQVFTVMTAIDLASVIGFYITIGIGASVTGDNASASVIFLLRMVRLVRVARLLKLSRDAKGIKLLQETAVRSRDGLLLLVAAVAISTLLFSSALWFSETSFATWDQNNTQWILDDGEVTPFQSVPDSFWYTISTMTTVGYGDNIPESLPGRIVGVLIMISGVLLLSFPNILIGSSFQHVNRTHNRDEARQKLGRLFRLVRMVTRFVRMWREFKLKGKIDKVTLSYKASLRGLPAVAGGSAASPYGTPQRDMTKIRSVNFFFRHSDYDWDYDRFVPHLKDGEFEFFVGSVYALEFLNRFLEGFSGVASIDELFESYILFPPQSTDSAYKKFGPGAIAGATPSNQITVPLKSDFMQLMCCAAEAKIMSIFVISRDEERVLAAMTKHGVELLQHYGDQNTIPCVRSVAEARLIWQNTTKQHAPVLLPVDGMRRWQLSQAQIPRRPVTNFTYDFKLSSSKRNNVFDDLEGLTALVRQMSSGVFAGANQATLQSHVARGFMEQHLKQQQLGGSHSASFSALNHSASSGAGAGGGGPTNGHHHHHHHASFVQPASLTALGSTVGMAAVPSSQSLMSAPPSHTNLNAAAAGGSTAATSSLALGGMAIPGGGGGSCTSCSCANCIVQSALGVTAADSLSTALSKMRNTASQLDSDSFELIVTLLNQQIDLLSTTVEVLKAAKSAADQGLDDEEVLRRLGAVHASSEAGDENSSDDDDDDRTHSDELGNTQEDLLGSMDASERSEDRLISPNKVIPL